MKLPFPVFTRLCEPYIKLSYVVTGGGVNREIYDPIRNDTVIMIDVGLRMAKMGGVTISVDYIKYVMRYARKYVTLFVVPDSWDFKQYMENIARFIGFAKRLSDRDVDNMIPILPVHYFLLHADKYVAILSELQELFPAVLAGVPSNMVTASPTATFKCIRRQVICNHYIEAVTRDVVKRGFKTHVLGITRPTLDYVVHHRVVGVVSADTDKPHGRNKSKKASRREYCQAFSEWLEEYEQPEPSEWLSTVLLMG